MRILEISTGMIILYIAIGVVLVAGGILLYRFVILPILHKNKVRDLEKRFSYLDAKLIGQDSQYIHRIEIISRTNLLYLDKYENFSRRFKAIFETEDKYCESILKQLNSLVQAKQFKNIKVVFGNAEKGLNTFEESLNALDADLYAVIKLEEDCRKQIDYLKDIYRHVKQTYYAESGDLEMVANTFNKTFEKIDERFASYDELLESAEYDEINNQIPEMNNVLIALGKVLLELPTLCSLTKTVVTEKIAEIQIKYKETEKQGVPLYHLSFKNRVDDWKKRLQELNKRIINLQCSGIHTECDLIITEINNFAKQLDNEISSRDYYRANYQEIYENVNNVQKVFLKITTMLPNIESIYIIGAEQKSKFEELNKAIDALGKAKRYLDGFVMSGIKQPYSLLKGQLDELKSNYELVNEGVTEFKNYIDCLKTNAEETYKMIYVYFHRMKEVEKVLRDINMPKLFDSFQDKFDAVYEILNYIYDKIRTRPIDVDDVTNKIEQMKKFASAIFEEVDKASRLCSLSEKQVVLLNQYRDEQDISQNLSQIEISFFNGDFVNAYEESAALLKSKVAENV